MVGVEVVEIVCVGAADFGKRGLVGAEDGFAPLHGFDGGQSEALGDGGEEKSCAMGIEPASLTVVDNANHGDVGVLVKLCTKLMGIGGMVIAGYDESVARKAVHEWQ